MIELLNYDIKILSLIFNHDLNIEDVRLMKPNMFVNVNTKKLFTVILKNINEYNIIPTMDVVVKSVYAEIDNADTISKQLYNDIFNRIVNVSENVEDLNSLKIVRANILQLIKKSEYKQLILDSALVIKNANSDIDLEPVISKLRDINSIGTHDEIGMFAYDNIEYRYKNEKLLRKPITTGSPVLDVYLDGGLGIGELGIVSAPPGVGKSWLLTNLGVSALRAGYNVVHYTLELSEAYTAKRYDAVITQIPFGLLQERYVEVNNKLKQFNKRGVGKLLVKQYPTNFATVEMLISHVKMTRNLGFNPDLVIVDYGDLLLDTTYGKSDNTYLTSGIIYANLRGAAQQLGTALWTASQTNRESISQNIVYGDKMSSSIKKLEVADFVMTFNRDKTSEIGNLYIVKSRFYGDGVALTALFNANNGVLIVNPPGQGHADGSSLYLNNNKTIQEDSQLKMKLSEYLKNNSNIGKK